MDEIGDTNFLGRMKICEYSEPPSPRTFTPSQTPKKRKFQFIQQLSCNSVSDLYFLLRKPNLGSLRIRQDGFAKCFASAKIFDCEVEIHLSVNVDTQILRITSTPKYRYCIPPDRSFKFHERPSKVTVGVGAVIVTCAQSKLRRHGAGVVQHGVRFL